MAGTSFGRYRLVRLLARGGMAEVYLAVLEGQAGFEKRLALKRILPIYGDLDEFTELFVDEARISVSLDHSNIVQTFDFGLHEGEPFLAMEYVDGPDLEKVLVAARKLKRPLGFDAMLYVATRVAAALDYAHSRIDESGRPLAIIHRDVSPPNVLLSVSGDVKITDFGVARYAMRLSRSRPGVVRGKYAYMSHEQLLGNEIDHRSDIFSLGTLLYEMTAGHNPFLGSTDYQTMERVVAAAPAPVRDQRPGMPEDLARIITKCLHPTPDGRYQTAGELRRDLASVQFRRGVIDDPSSLVEELWALFPRQLSRRGVPLKSRPKLDISTPSVGAPRMRGPGPTDSPWGPKPGARAPAQLADADESDEFDEDDLTIPHIVGSQDSVPTQPLDGDSKTLDAPQQVPASLARLDVAGVSDPFGTLMPRRRSSSPVKVRVEQDDSPPPQVRHVTGESRKPEPLGPDTTPASEALTDETLPPVAGPPPSHSALDAPDPFAAMVAGAAALSKAEPPGDASADVVTDDGLAAAGEATVPTPASPPDADITDDAATSSDATDPRDTTDPRDATDPRSKGLPPEAAQSGGLAALAKDRGPLSPPAKPKPKPEPAAEPEPAKSRPDAPASWSEDSGIGMFGCLAIAAAMALVVFLVFQNFGGSEAPAPSHETPAATPAPAPGVAPAGETDAAPDGVHTPGGDETGADEANPEAEDAVQTPEATPEATPAPTPRPEPTPRADPTPRAEPTPRVERTPSPTPRPQATPAPKPTPEPQPTPESAAPTPDWGAPGGSEPPFDPAPAAARVKVTIESAPPGAALTVSGADVGAAPHVATAEPGTMLEVTARLDGHLSTTRFLKVGNADVTETMELAPSGPKEVAVGIVKVSSEPWAYLAVDGRVLGNVLGTDPIELKLTPGEHVLAVENPVVGWSDRRTVVVKAGETSVVTFKQ